MKLQKLVRQIVEEQFIEEDKKSMLRKTFLTSDQQEQALKLFKEYPHLEWNDYKKLTWEDNFLPLFMQGSYG